MKRLLFPLIPKTAFSTPLQGDTLFGQCCWAIRHLYGENRLKELLNDYCNDNPFMIIADALPQGFISRPTIPASLLGFNHSDAKERKSQKKLKWFSLSDILNQPLNHWADFAKDETEMLASFNLTGKYLISDKPQDHNSLNRLTGTTGKDNGFAPFQRQMYWYHPAIKLSLMIIIDEHQISENEVLTVLNYVGLSGYGKEASCGLGKFIVEKPTELLFENNSRTVLTLSACAPQGLNWQTEDCYYQIFTRFGKHGDMAIHQGKPFKNPILLAAPFAILTTQENNNSYFVGQGLTRLSETIKETVHQGYAPIIPVRLT